MSVARRAEGEKAAAPPGGAFYCGRWGKYVYVKGSSDGGKRNSTNDVTRRLKLFVELATKCQSWKKGRWLKTNIVSCREWIIFIHFPETLLGGRCSKSFTVQVIFWVMHWFRSLNCKTRCLSICIWCNLLLYESMSALKTGCPMLTEPSGFHMLCYGI